MPSAEELSELNQLCAGAKVMPEGDSVYIFLPALKLPKGCSPAQVDALLRIRSPLTDYPTRLFYASKIACSKQLNWNSTNVVILQRNWFAYSWSNVAADRPPVELVAEHLRALA
jgi:hypothetical protein